MISRERVLRAINFQEPDRVPVDLGGTRMTGISGENLVAMYETVAKYGRYAPA